LERNYRKRSVKNATFRRKRGRIRIRRMSTNRGKKTACTQHTGLRRRVNQRDRRGANRGLAIFDGKVKHVQFRSSGRKNRVKTIYYEVAKVCGNLRKTMEKQPEEGQGLINCLSLKVLLTGGATPVSTLCHVPVKCSGLG